MNMEIQPLKETYYEYATKIPNGLQVILSQLEQQQFESAFIGLANLAEGIQALSAIEQALEQQGLASNSRIHEATVIFASINEALAQKDIPMLITIIDENLVPTFSSASEWAFHKHT